MSTVGSLDAIATKVDAITGIKKAYSVGVASGVAPIPRSIDDGPVAMVMLRGASQASGNAEALLLDVAVEVWVQADSAGYANKTLLQFVDLMRTAMRTDMNLGGECTRCSLVDIDALDAQTVNDRNWLILPFVLEVLIERFDSDATA